VTSCAEENGQPVPVQVRFTCAPAGTLLVTSRVTVVAEPAGENASLSVGSGRSVAATTV
jgi:hypothetical protein